MYMYIYLLCSYPEIEDIYVPISAYRNMGWTYMYMYMYVHVPVVLISRN